MATETADFIGQLDQSKPQGSDSLGEADDHLRLTKKCLTATMQGGVDDAYDTPLIAGPRYLNSLVGKYPDPEDFVTLSTTQTITGAKTFNQPIKADLHTTAGDNLATESTGTAYFGFFAPSYLLSDASDSLKHWYGGDISTAATVLTTDNLYEVGDTVLTIDNRSPAARFGGTWAQIAEGRALFGAGQGPTDLNGDAELVPAGESTGAYNVKLSAEQLPAHDHPYRSMTTVDVTGGSTNLIKNSPDDGNASGSTGMSAAPSGAPHPNYAPAFALYVWQKTG